MTNEQKIIVAIQDLLGRPIEAQPHSLLKDDLGLSSLNLVELTVALHSVFGVDIGRRAVERKANPLTVSDIALLLE